jgi:hypothetical protein
MKPVVPAYKRFLLVVSEVEAKDYTIDARQDRPWLNTSRVTCGSSNGETTHQINSASVPPVFVATTMPLLPSLDCAGSNALHEASVRSVRMAESSLCIPPAMYTTVAERY